MKCLFGDPACSLSVISYFQCGLTVAAFFAAFRAGTYAKQTLIYEQHSILAVEKIPSHLDGTKIIDSYLEHVASGFNAARPTNFNKDQWGQCIFMLFSLGRSPIINGRLHIIATSSDGKDHALPLDIGCISVDSKICLRVWVNPELTSVIFKWDKATHKKDNICELHWRSEKIEIQAAHRLPKSSTKPTTRKVPTRKPRP